MRTSYRQRPAERSRPTAPCSYRSTFSPTAGKTPLAPSGCLTIVSSRKGPRMAKTNTPSGTALVRLALASAIVLCIQVYSWATTACQVPNPSTVFCTKSPLVTFTCANYSGGDASSCTSHWDAFERNQFPQGAAPSKKGTTKQVQADCLRYKYCAWDPDTKTCSSATTWGAWEPANKTVVGDAACPTDED